MKIRYNNPSKVLSMLTKLESYIRFHEKIDHIIESFDDNISEIYEMENDIEKIIEKAKRYKTPEIDYTEQSIYALLLSIMANAKASRTHYLSLRARIEALNRFINLSYCS